MRRDNERCNQILKEHWLKILNEEELSPFMFINDVSKLFDMTVAHEVDRLNISRGYRRMLFFLSHNDGISQYELVRLTNLTAPTVSVTLSKMEKDGFVKRVINEDDMRQVKVYLTDKGREHNNRITQKCSEVEEKKLVGITDEERKELCRILKKIYSNFMNS
ncbi:MAG: MarR family winged helix-turn-helix transcriptional regulator [Oscillospiraceae bacterium]